MEPNSGLKRYFKPLNSTPKTDQEPTAAEASNEAVSNPESNREDVEEVVAFVRKRKRYDC